MSLVSIIVPVHNTARYLDTCVASIQNQTMTDIEIVLVENASQDNSLEICHRLAREDDRIRVIHIDKGDPSTARNAGVRLAASEFVAFVDSDDTIEPDTCADLYATARENDLDLVVFSCVYKYSNRKDWYPYPNDGAFRILTGKELATLNIAEEIPRFICTLFIRKTVFDHLQFPEDMYYEDRACTYLFMAFCRRGGLIRKAYYNYRQHEGSISHTKTFTHYRDHVISNYWRLQFIRECGFYSKEEILRLSVNSANLYYRKMRHMFLEARTESEKSETLCYYRKRKIVPAGTRLRLKAFLIRFSLRFLLLGTRLSSEVVTRVESRDYLDRALVRLRDFYRQKDCGL